MLDHKRPDKDIRDICRNRPRFLQRQAQLPHQRIFLEQSGIQYLLGNGSYRRGDDIRLHHLGCHPQDGGRQRQAAAVHGRDPRRCREELLHHNQPHAHHERRDRVHQQADAADRLHFQQRLQSGPARHKGVFRGRVCSHVQGIRHHRKLLDSSDKQQQIQHKPLLQRHTQRHVLSAEAGRVRLLVLRGG